MSSSVMFLLYLYILVQGHFGTIILQIPVEDGFEGGELEIDSQINRKKPLETSMLDLSSDSDRSFYVNFLNVNCVREMRPLTRGWRIELAYNILWKPEIATLVLPNISSFLVTLVIAFLFKIRKVYVRIL